MLGLKSLDLIGILTNTHPETLKEHVVVCAVNIIPSLHKGSFLENRN